MKIQELVLKLITIIEQISNGSLVMMTIGVAKWKEKVPCVSDDAKGTENCHSLLVLECSR